MFVHFDYIDDLFGDFFFSIPPLGGFKSSDVVGKFMGSDVYISHLLSEYEIFVGQSVREISITKRNLKINKILKIIY